MDISSSRTSGIGRAERSTSAHREHPVVEDIRTLERALKELPFVDLRVDCNAVEEVVQKAVKDLVANLEEHQEITSMMKTVDKEIKELEDRSRTLKRMVMGRKRDMSPQSPEEQQLEGKTQNKIAVLKKLQQVKLKNEEQKSMISRFLTNLCRQSKRAELEERLKHKKAELAIEKLTKEKAALEEKLKMFSSSTKHLTNDENDSRIGNHRPLERTQSAVLREKERLFKLEEKNGHLLKTTSVNTTVMRTRDTQGQSKADLEDGKTSELSRKGSFKTNVSRRYQQEDDDDDEDELDALEGAANNSDKSSPRGSFGALSHTLSQRKSTTPVTEKRNTHDIKSLERTCQPSSLKLLDTCELGEGKKKYFSNTANSVLQYARKHKSDIFSAAGPSGRHRTEEEPTAAAGDKESAGAGRVLYKNHFLLS